MSQAPPLQQSKSQQALGEVLDHEEVAAGDAGDVSAANVEQQLHGAPLRLVSPLRCLWTSGSGGRDRRCNFSATLRPYCGFACRGDLSMHITGLDQGTCSLLAEEHTARVKAEAAGEHAVRRLTVAQEQLVEYAQQQAADTVSVLEEAQALEALLTGGGSAASNGSTQPSASGPSPANGTADAEACNGVTEAAVSSGKAAAAAVPAGANQLRVRMQELRKRLLAMASEADNFAAQQKADLARSKRSLSQARRPCTRCMYHHVPSHDQTVTCSCAVPWTDLASALNDRGVTTFPTAPDMSTDMHVEQADLSRPEDDDVEMKRQRDTPDDSADAEPAEVRLSTASQPSRALDPGVACAFHRVCITLQQGLGHARSCCWLGAKVQA